MTQAVPAIYAPRYSVPKLNAGARVGAALLAIACGSIMGIAAWLAPSHNGFGSHTELGLQPCEFLHRTGVPCPSCGMTTSFTFFAHGQLLGSFYVQPMGFVLAVLCVATFWVCLYAAITAKPAWQLLRIVPGRYYLIPLIVFAVAAWGWKIFIHTHGLDGW